MAWRCSGKTNAELIDNLFKAGLITSAKVREAMIKVDRAHYCPDQTYAYEDSPQSIGHAATISAPHMHAHAAESLLPFLGAGSRVLDIGSGSGYLTQVLAELVFAASPNAPSSTSASGNKDGKGAVGGIVVGLEHIQALRDLGEGNMRKSEAGRRFLEEGSVKFVKGDGRKGWAEDGGKWDAIHVGAAAVEVHSHLVEQLKNPGRMFIPVSDSRGDQHIWVIDKDASGKVHKKKLYGVRYVPLTDSPQD